MVVYMNGACDSVCHSCYGYRTIGIGLTCSVMHSTLVFGAATVK